jgi:hypothetical protein
VRRAMQRAEPGTQPRFKGDPRTGLLAARTNCAYTRLRADGRRPGADMEDHISNTKPSIDRH